MTLEFEVFDFFDATPQQVYEAWLNSDAHAAMTGGSADISNHVGGEFEAWDGYIQGKNLELDYGTRIVQSWRTVEFNDYEQDSQIEVLFEKVGEQTRVTIRHTNLPQHGEQYKQGWIDNYFEPMKAYFEKHIST